MYNVIVYLTAMPNQSISQTSDSSNRATALRTLYQAISNTIDTHEDNPQLLLFIGIALNDVNIVQNCMENYNIDANQGITGRNQHILEQFGCNFPAPDM